MREQDLAVVRAAIAGIREPSGRAPSEALMPLDVLRHLNPELADELEREPVTVVAVNAADAGALRERLPRAFKDYGPIRGDVVLAGSTVENLLAVREPDLDVAAFFKQAMHRVERVRDIVETSLTFNSAAWTGDAPTVTAPLSWNVPDDSPRLRNRAERRAAKRARRVRL